MGRQLFPGTDCFCFSGGWLRPLCPCKGISIPVLLRHSRMADGSAAYAIMRQNFRFALPLFCGMTKQIFCRIRHIWGIAVFCSRKHYTPNPSIFSKKQFHYLPSKGTQHSGKVIFFPPVPTSSFSKTFKIILHFSKIKYIEKNDGFRGAQSAPLKKKLLQTRIEFFATAFFKEI